MKYKDLNADLVKSSGIAISIALDSIEKSGEFVPFVLHGENSDKIKRIIAESVDEIIEIAEDVIEDLSDGSETAILAYNDTIVLNDGSFDAVIIQISNIDEDSGYSFGQLYKNDDGKISLLKEIIFLGNVRNWLI